jgi:multidrug transporter EmrE-like cation transporter
MDVSRLNTGEKIAGISGIALLIIMFLSWFGAGEVGGIDVGDIAGVDTSFNAWQAFDIIDLLLALAALSGIALAVTAASQTDIDLPVALSAITAGLGALGTLLVIYRLLDPPFDADREFGVFLGLIAVAGIAYGGWTAMQQEGASVGGTTGGGTAPPPPPPPTSAPPGGPAA